MEYNTLALPSGLRVIHLPSASPVVYCGYAIAAGTRDELPGQEGMAHFCEHTTFKGTARRRAWHILNCLESVGGDLNAFTTKEDTVYYAATLRDHVARAVDLLTDIVFHSRYPQQELDKEVEVFNAVRGFRLERAAVVEFYDQKSIHSGLLFENSFL